MTVGKLLIGLLIPILIESTYVENLAANINNKRHEKFMPLVAFSCGYRNQYMTENGTWKSDEERYATCFSGKLDILKYCRKTYPTMNITNIVEYKHEATIGKWCREEGSPCKWTHTVRPYQCIDGEFHSEALQVPHDCQFSHVNTRGECNDFQSWKVEADKQCAAKRNKSNKSMIVRSFAVLEPCALDMFSGVEFVCCPNEQATKDVKKNLDDDDDDDDDEEDDDINESDDYSEESDEEDEKDNAQDPYFRAANWTNEHEDFKSATLRMDAKHKKKVDKVMNEWAQIEARYSKVKEKSPLHAKKIQEVMKERFQKTVGALEEEHKRMKKEIEAVHEERVQAMLNEKKRDATHNYRQSLSTHVNKPNKHNVLQTLKAYIRAEEKDRLHTLNRYRHMLRTDVDEASIFKATVLHRLRYINLRINGTLAMLRDFPDLEKYVKPIAMTFWKQLRLDNTPEFSDTEISSLDNLDDDTKNKKLVDMYSEAVAKERIIHPSAKLDVKAPSTTTTVETITDVEKIKILPTESSDSEEDDDEYYEDEQDEEIKKTDAQKKAKVIEIKPKAETVPAEKFKAPKLVETSVQTDDSDDDSSSSSSFSSESDEDEEDDEKNVKELRVDIEPIIDEPPSFYRHDKLTQNELARSESLLGSTHFMFFMFTMAIVCVGMFLVTAARRRRAMRGFIEVDVYTPEERHVAGMQVNGYENPTYSFFDSKA